eukprot:9492090-Pyramimonas_sp.AAC.2
MIEGASSGKHDKYPIPPGQTPMLHLQWVPRFWRPQLGEGLRELALDRAIIRHNKSKLSFAVV